MVQGMWMDPWLGNQDPTCHGTTKPMHRNWRSPQFLVLCLSGNFWFDCEFYALGAGFCYTPINSADFVLVYSEVSWNQLDPPRLASVLCWSGSRAAFNLRLTEPYDQGSAFSMPCATLASEDTDIPNLAEFRLTIFPARFFLWPQVISSPACADQYSARLKGTPLPISGVFCATSSSCLPHKL